MTLTAGRRHVVPDEPLAVFLIGLRINRWYRPDAWAPALAAMGPMLAELYADPDSGFLRHRTTLAAGGPLLVQYWRSAHDVQRYAREAGRRHRPAWRAFYDRARKAPGAVGIWHELYDVAPGAASATYVDMPAVGLDGAVPGRRQALSS
ncbi:MAG: DUF4188 domain-containing protein [Actinomycetota bacterium]